MHRTLNVTPAMAAAVVDKLWSMDDLATLVEEFDAAQPRKRPGRNPKATQ